MNTIRHIVRKEFQQIFRNKTMLPIIFVLPFVQLIILSNAATFEVKNITLAYIDHDRTSLSRELVEKFTASPYFEVIADYPSAALAQNAFLEEKATAILEIPRHFERDLLRDKNIDLSVTINAIDGAAAGVTSTYINQILLRFNQGIQMQFYLPSDPSNLPQNIETIPIFWYNDTLNYKTFMVPGILVLLVTMITLFLSGMNIVREKELGTLEQINVTPIRKHHFIIGKLFPFLILGILLFTVGLIIAMLLFKIPIVGSLVLMYGYTGLYITVILGIGLFISNFSDTQQQAMFISWFFMVIFILMSGLFTPVESMPYWAQGITEFNPVKHYVQVMRMVMLKGAGLSDIFPQILKTLVFALVMNTLAIISYKKVD